MSNKEIKLEKLEMLESIINNYIKKQNEEIVERSKNAVFSRGSKKEKEKLANPKNQNNMVTLEEISERNPHIKYNDLVVHLASLEYIVVAKEIITISDDVDIYLKHCGGALYEILIVVSKKLEKELQKWCDGVKRMQEDDEN